MRIFISGGCKNGKSFYAQRLSKSFAVSEDIPLYYIATMRSTGAEDDERITRHVGERAGWGFITVEQPQNIEEILHKCDKNGSFLLDSLTALLANEMFSDDGSFFDDAADKIADGLLQVINSVANIVVVSDYIYGDAAFYDPMTECYRRSLAELDRAAAQCCDVVLEAAFSNVIAHKGDVFFSQKKKQKNFTALKRT